MVELPTFAWAPEKAVNACFHLATVHRRLVASSSSSESLVQILEFLDMLLHSKWCAGNNDAVFLCLGDHLLDPRELFLLGATGPVHHDLDQAAKDEGDVSDGAFWLEEAV